MIATLQKQSTLLFVLALVLYCGLGAVVEYRPELLQLAATLGALVGMVLAAESREERRP